MVKQGPEFFVKIISSILFLTLIGLGTLGFKLWQTAASEYEKGLAYLHNDNEPELAVIAFENSAKAWFPGNKFASLSLKKLSIIARAAHMRGDIEASRRLWHSIRSCVISTRHFIQPNEDYLKMADFQIANLEDKTSAEIEKQLKLPPDPSALKSLLMVLGLLLQIVALLIFILNVFKKPYSQVALAFSFMGLIIWLLMAYWA